MRRLWWCDVPHSVIGMVFSLSRCGLAHPRQHRLGLTVRLGLTGGVTYTCVVPMVFRGSHSDPGHPSQSFGAGQTITAQDDAEIMGSSLKWRSIPDTVSFPRWWRRTFVACCSSYSRVVRIAAVSPHGRLFFFGLKSREQSAVFVYLRQLCLLVFSGERMQDVLRHKPARSIRDDALLLLLFSELFRSPETPFPDGSALLA